VGDRDYLWKLRHRVEILTFCWSLQILALQLKFCETKFYQPTVGCNLMQNQHLFVQETTAS